MFAFLAYFDAGGEDWDGDFERHFPEGTAHKCVCMCVCVLIISGGFYNHDYMYKLGLFKIIWYYQHKAVRMEMTLEIN